jgi:D-sedoheptulose 7-phosphate isomerase
MGDLAFVEIITGHLAASAQVKQAVAERCLPDISAAARILVDAFRNGHKLLACGNGGSAADAQHIVGELVCKLTMERAALPAIALTTNSSILTATGNDYAYDHVFVRQVEALAQPGDVLIAISTSGRSASVNRAALLARTHGVHTVALTGRDGGELAQLCDIAIVVPSASTQHIQEAHIAIGHVLCEVVERELFGAEN